MFEEIDVNGDGDLQYSEFTSYLVELANGRYDHHHIDQLLHTDYRVLEPVGNDDRIDVVSVVWYGQLGHFVLFEKGQHRFKVLDAQKRVVKVVRGHMGEMIDSEWLPLHGVLVTSSSDRTHQVLECGREDRARRQSDPATLRPLCRSGQVHAYSSSLRLRLLFCCLCLCLSHLSLCGYMVAAVASGQLVLVSRAVVLGRHTGPAAGVGMWTWARYATPRTRTEGRVTALCSGDDGWLVSGGMDGWVRVWEGSELRLVGEWRHDGGARAVCWDSERRLVLSGGDDECVRVWSAEHRRLLRTINFRSDTDLTNKPHHSKPHSTAPSTARLTHPPQPARLILRGLLLSRRYLRR